MIVARNLSKRFRLYRRPADRLKEIILRRPYHHVHEALHDVSFEVAPGRALGIIGHNGAGKSTLLKILTGVLLPDAGCIDIQGRITGLLELGTGFNMELTGRQNILNNGLLLGMTPEEIEARREAIIAFAELGDYIDEPLKTYSSGMAMRLAFAIAIHADPQCFVVDEALSVGDAHFQQKCMRRIREFRAQGGSLIFVSHDLNAVKMLCDDVLVLDHGRVAAYAPPEEAVNVYNRLIARLDDDPTAPRTGYGTRRAEILQATLRGLQSGGSTVASGEATELCVTLRAHEDIPDLTLGFMIRDRLGQDIHGTNTHLQGIPLKVAGGATYRACWRMPLNIAPGKYTLTLALHRGPDHTHECLHWEDNLLGFEVAGMLGPPFAGLCRLESEFHLMPSAETETS
jgi:lipopolysaccharide transport system ATP-binding protein